MLVLTFLTAFYYLNMENVPPPLRFKKNYNSKWDIIPNKNVIFVLLCDNFKTRWGVISFFSSAHVYCAQQLVFLELGPFSTNIYIQLNKFKTIKFPLNIIHLMSSASSRRNIILRILLQNTLCYNLLLHRDIMCINISMYLQRL